MGAEKEGAKNGEKKAADAGEKKEEAKVISVYKMDMHCEGCARKIRHAVKDLEGVKDAKTDCAANKLTVTGKVDPAKVKAWIEDKKRMEVEIVSPQPKKDAGGGKKPDEKAGKKPEKKKPKEKEPEPPKASTVVWQTRVDGDGSISKIMRIISESKGVESVTVDKAKDLVTVKGTMELVRYLKEKLEGNVDEKKNKKGGGGDKKEEKGGDAKAEKKSGGGAKAEKKEGDGAKKEERARVRVRVRQVELSLSVN